MNDVIFKQVILPSGKKKYIPCGINEMELPTGLYFINVRKNVKETVSCSYLGQLYKVGDPKVIDLTEVCGMHELANKILENEEFRQLLEKPHTISDIVRKIVAIINSFKNK